MTNDKSYFLFAGKLAEEGAFVVNNLHDVETLCALNHINNLNSGSCVSVEYEEEQGECGYLIYAGFGNEYGILGQSNSELLYCGMIEDED